MAKRAREIETAPSQINPGRYCFYIDGEYRGSAGSKAEAIRAAKQLLAKADTADD